MAESSNVLRLYVVGSTPVSQRAIQSVQSICETELAGTWRVEVIDVLEKPQLAMDDRIIATPALIKAVPPPVRRIVGDLCDREQVLLGLDIRGPEQS